MNHSPIITPARKGYSVRNRRRYTRQRAIAAVLAMLAAFWLAVAFLILSAYPNQ